MFQQHIYHVNVLEHELFLPSQYFSLNHKTVCTLNLHSPHIYNNLLHVLAIFMYIIHILVWLL